MPYYFPLRAIDGLTTQSISYALTAISASAAQSRSISVATASYAQFSGSIPLNGTTGISKTILDCTGTAPKGATGPTGSRGPKGDDNTTCPEGTIECVGLNVSLSLYINPNVGSGSQYSKVCMEIPNGCSVANVGCPGTLPIAYPTILPNP